tara:strand:+ start:60 stop:707 length:648 start_codon:yes stop_codon:yes gene_type:complete
MNVDKRKMLTFKQILFVFLVLLASKTYAQQPASLTTQDYKDIDLVEDYLNELKSLKSKFVQWSSSGHFSEGIIFIKRPNKLRVQYIKPSNIQIYGNEFWITHVDTELETISHIPLEKTLANFLIRKNIKLGEEITVAQVIRGSNLISIDIFNTAEPDSGSLKLTFNKHPLLLREWTVVDNQGIKTKVTLLAPAFNVSISPKVFVLDSQQYEESTE